MKLKSSTKYYIANKTSLQKKQLEKTDEEEGESDSPA